MILVVCNEVCVELSIFGMDAYIEMLKLIIGKTLKPNQASCQHAVY